MHKTQRAIALSLLAAAVAFEAPPARADDWEADQAAQSLKIEFKELAERIGSGPADPGRDTAPTRSPPWCDGADTSGSESVSSIARYVESAMQYTNTWQGLFSAAAVTCKWPKEKAVQQAVHVIEQDWINITGLSEAQALETFKIHMNKAKYDADKDKLCGELKVPDEIEGEAKLFAKAKRTLFCDLMWNDDGARVPDELIHYLETSADDDELVRLALIVDHTQIAIRGNLEDRWLLNYVMDQYDFDRLAPDKLTKLLDAAPYKGNSYARATLLESIGRAQRGIAAFRAAVKAKASDKDWTELLVAAPKRGVDGWTKAAATWKAELDRSNAFETKFWGPSRKALKGCWAELKPDFQKVAKTLPAATAIELQDALSDPIASLLFQRLAACAAIDTDKNQAQLLMAFARDSRYSRGPRTAAYYEALATLGAIIEDRTKFPVSPADYVLWRNKELDEAAMNALSSNKTGTYDVMGFVAEDNAGIVKSVKKGKDGLEVTFVSESHKVMGQDCVSTNKIYGINSDGTLRYYQKCHDTGWITVDDTPGAIIVLDDWSDGIKKGAYVEFSAARGKAPRVALPRAVFADKNKKKVINWMGIGI